MRSEGAARVRPANLYASRAEAGVRPSIVDRRSTNTATTKPSGAKQPGTTAATKPMTRDHFTDAQGNVYRREEDRTQRYESGRWNKVPETVPADRSKPVQPVQKPAQPSIRPPVQTPSQPQVKPPARPATQQPARDPQRIQQDRQRGEQRMRDMDQSRQQRTQPAPAPKPAPSKAPSKGGGGGRKR